MSPRSKAFIISLLLHGAVMSLFIGMNIMAAVVSKPVVIDFTLVEPDAPPSPAPAAKSPAQAPKSPAPREPRRNVASRPEPVRQQPVAAFKPAFEAQGPASVLSDRKGASPPAASQIAAPAGEGGGGPSSGASGASGGPSAEQLKSRYKAEHFAYIQKIIQEHMEYPERAKRMGQFGRVVVAITILKSGHVKEIRVLKSTGHEILDESVRETVNRVEPFPPPPIPVTLNIPFSFHLE